MNSRSRVELMHQIGVLYSWATDPRDTISALSERQAKKAVEEIKTLWEIIDRRSKQH